MIRLRFVALASIAGMFVLFAGCGSNSQPFNDTPVITSLFPSSATAGSPGFTLSIAGTGFISTSVAYWNNTPRTTTYNTTTTQITIQVTAQDIANPGTAQIIVVSPTPGGGPSTAVNFTINPPANPQPAITSLSPSSTAVGVLPAGNILTVNGTNFVSSSSVAFNGNTRQPNFVNSSLLTVQMNASDVASNSTIQVTVTNPAPGGGVSGAAPFKVGTGGSVRLKASVLASGVQFPELVSVSAMGGPSNGASKAPTVTSDGRFVAFYSTATNLVAQGTSGNIFVRDTCLGVANCSARTIAVDLAPDGSVPDGAAHDEVAMSGDGRYVAFASAATNIVSGFSSSNSQVNVYVRDLCTGIDAPAGCVPRTDPVSVVANGSVAMGARGPLSISSNGRFVAFLSAASNFAGDAATTGDGIYVRDTCGGASGINGCIPQTYSVDLGENSMPNVGDLAISGNGRYVVFEASDSSGTSSSQANSHIFLADTCRGLTGSATCIPSTEEISVGADGSPLATLNQSPSVSADGRFVAFVSSASGGDRGALLRDTCLGALSSCVPSTAVVAENAVSPAMSANGRYISFVATSPSASGGASNTGLLYVYDTCYGASGSCAAQTYAITSSGANPASPPLTVNASPAFMTPDGSFLVFSSSVAIPGLPSSGLGDVLLTVTPF